MFKTYANYDTVTAVDFNALMRQGIVPVSGNTERDSFFPSPIQGQQVYNAALGMNQIYGASGWMLAVGLVPIRPTSLVTTGSGVGTSINTDGSVSFGTTGNELTVNGVFSSRFKRYKVVGEYTVSGGVNGSVLYLTSGGTPNTTTNYHSQSTYSSGSSAAGSQVLSDTKWSFALVSSVDMAFELTFISPAHAAFTKGRNHSSSTNSGYGDGTSSYLHGATTAFDGFRIGLSTLSGRTFNGGELMVYGLV